MSDPQKLEAPAPAWWVRLLFGRRPRRTVIRVLVLVGVSLFAFKVVLIPIRVQGISMIPAYHNGQINFINKWAYWRHPIQRGDVVGIAYLGSKGLLLKRIIGLPGERVGMRRGVVLIDGHPLAEPYTHQINTAWTMLDLRLGPKEYYVVGDNRSMPLRDHFHAAVDVSLILGRVLF